MIVYVAVKPSQKKSTICQRDVTFYFSVCLGVIIFDIFIAWFSSVDLSLLCRPTKLLTVCFITSSIWMNKQIKHKGNGWKLQVMKTFSWKLEVIRNLYWLTAVFKELIILTLCGVDFRTIPVTESCVSQSLDSTFLIIKSQRLRDNKFVIKFLHNNQSWLRESSTGND